MIVSQSAMDESLLRKKDELSRLLLIKLRRRIHMKKMLLLRISQARTQLLSQITSIHKIHPYKSKLIKVDHVKEIKHT